MCVVSTHFSGSNRTTGYTKVARGKKVEHEGKVLKHEVGKTTDREEAKGLFSVQMHEVATAICTHAHALLWNIINFVFIPSFRVFTLLTIVPSSLTFVGGKFSWFHQNAVIMMQRM